MISLFDNNSRFHTIQGLSLNIMVIYIFPPPSPPASFFQQFVMRLRLYIQLFFKCCHTLILLYIYMDFQATADCHNDFIVIVLVENKRDRGHISIPHMVSVLLSPQRQKQMDNVTVMQIFKIVYVS